MSSVRKGTLAQFGPSLLPWTHWLYQKESAMATNNSLWTMEIMRKWRSTCRNVARAGKILIKYPTHNSVCSESFQSLSRRKRKQESLSLTMILKNIWHPVNGTVKSHCVIKNHWTHRSEKAMAPHSSTLAWKIPWMEEPGELQSIGSLRVGYDWATSLSLFTFMHWRRKWQPTPVFFPGESQGQGSLVGCRLWGHTESDTTEVT